MSRYKAKQCPTCGVTHKKQGKFCSRSCGNSRSFTQTQRRDLSVKLRELAHHPDNADKRDQGKDSLVVAKIKAKNSHDPDAAELTLDDFFLEPVVKTLPDGQFVQDGDLWTDADW